MDDEKTTGRSKRVLIADPQPIFRLGLVALLATVHADWEIIETDTLDDHRTQLIGGVFDLLILEGRLLGAELGRDGRTRTSVNLFAQIVAVTEVGDSVGALGCLAAGARATISRSDSTVRMLGTIESVVEHHEHPIAPHSHEHRVAAPEPSDILNLTARQIDVLRLLAKGQSNKVIARDLGLSVSTVKVHLNTVFRALGARNRVEAVVRARPFQARMIRHGIT